MNTSILFYEQQKADDSSITAFDQQTEIEYQPIVDEDEEDILNTQIQPEKDPETAELSTQSPRVKKKSDRFNVEEYENWDGEIVYIDNQLIRARIQNTLMSYSPRLIEVKRSFFEKKAGRSNFFMGEEFELSYRKIKKPKGQIENQMTLRMIDVTKVDPSKLEEAVRTEIEALSFLFE